MLDIHGIMTELSRSIMTELSQARSIFHSEADFQHDLAWQIHESVPNSRIRLEYNHTPLYRISDENPVYLDVFLPTERIAIEVKYKIKGRSRIPRRLLAEVDNEAFILAYSGAVNHTRYLFLKDVERVESVGRGFAIILTNEPAYWNRGPVSDRIPDDDEFRIHEGRELSGDLNWQDPESASAKKYPDPISLSGSYTLNWWDYSEVLTLPDLDLATQGRDRQFRYLAVAVGN